jgi:hypothetical protein
MKVGRGEESLLGVTVNLLIWDRGGTVYSVKATVQKSLYIISGKYKYAIMSRYSTKAIVNGPVHVLYTSIGF